MANNATFTIRLEGGVAPSAGKVTVGIEVRMCVGQNGNRLYLHAPFKNAQIGNNASALAGDDKRIGTCQRKFNNVANFLGFSYMPNTNATRGIGESKAKGRKEILRLRENEVQPARLSLIMPDRHVIPSPTHPLHRSNILGITILAGGTVFLVIQIEHDRI